MTVPLARAKANAQSGHRAGAEDKITIVIVSPPTKPDQIVQNT